MTNILIPTDFTPASFKLAEQSVTLLNRKVNIVFFHAYEMPFYYLDLYGMDSPPYYNLLNRDFWNLCNQLKNKYPRLINEVSFKSMQGDTNVLFRNFAEANKIDLIVCPDNYEYIKTHDRCLNPITFFKNSKLPLLQQLVNQPSIGADRMMHPKQNNWATA